MDSVDNDNDSDNDGEKREMRQRPHDFRHVSLLTSHFSLLAVAVVVVVVVVIDMFTNVKPMAQEQSYGEVVEPDATRASSRDPTYS